MRIYGGYKRQDGIIVGGLSLDGATYIGVARSILARLQHAFGVRAQLLPGDEPFSVARIPYNTLSGWRTAGPEGRIIAVISFAGSLQYSDGQVDLGGIQGFDWAYLPSNLRYRYWASNIFPNNSLVILQADLMRG